MEYHTVMKKKIISTNGEDKSQMHYVKQKNPGKEEHMLYDSTNIKCKTSLW